MTDWGFGPDLNFSASATGKTIWSTSLTIGEILTIVRIRGFVHVLQTVSSAANSGMFGAMGIALVNSDAFAAGSGSIPGPFTDLNWDNWMWHSFWDVRTATNVLGDGVNATSITQRIEIDSKSMRKWDPAETLVGMFEVGIESGTAVVNVRGDTRLLLKAA